MDELIFQYYDNRVFEKAMDCKNVHEIHKPKCKILRL